MQVNFNNFLQTDIHLEFLKNFLTDYIFLENHMAQRNIAEALGISDVGIYFFHSKFEIAALFNFFFPNRNFFILQPDNFELDIIFKPITFNELTEKLEENSNNFIWINHTDLKTAEIRNLKKIKKQKDDNLIISNLSYSLARMNLNFQNYGFDFIIIESKNFYLPSGSTILIDLNKKINFNILPYESKNYILNKNFSDVISFLFSTNFYEHFLELKKYFYQKAHECSKIKILPSSGKKFNVSAVSLKIEKIERFDLFYNYLLFRELNVGFWENDKLLTLSFSHFTTKEEIDYFFESLKSYTYQDLELSLEEN